MYNLYPTLKRVRFRSGVLPFKRANGGTVPCRWCHFCESSTSPWSWQQRIPPVMVDIFSHDTRAFFFSKNWATPAQWPDFDDPDMGRSHKTHETTPGAICCSPQNFIRFTQMAILVLRSVWMNRWGRFRRCFDDMWRPHSATKSKRKPLSRCNCTIGPCNIVQYP